MKDGRFGVVMLSLIVVLQAIDSLTNALYFGGKWRDAILWCGCIAVVLTFLGLLWLTLWRHRTVAQVAAEKEAVRRLPQPTRSKEVFFCGMALVIATVTVYLWHQIGTVWSAPVVPPGYQAGLRVVGIVVAAGATWLVLCAAQTMVQWWKKS